VSHKCTKYFRKNNVSELKLDTKTHYTGNSRPIMKNYSDISYINNNWFTQIWEYLRDTTSTIKLTNCRVPRIKCKNDIVIMYKVQSLDIPKSKKRIFNNWRLYFQVESAADITTPNGEVIEKYYLQKKIVQTEKMEQKSRLRWPKQKMPCIKTFHLWKSIIANISGATNSGKLKHRLGNWVINPNKTQYFKTLMHHTTNI
jgi:hypothetical protein